FCGKRQDQVRQLFLGQDDVRLCDECVELCREIIEEEAGARSAQEPPFLEVLAQLRARRHLLDLDDWTPRELRVILENSGWMRRALAQSDRSLISLHGRVLVNLFYENSTRTRVSFELAGKRLGADVTNVAAAASSVAKGESLIDTVRTLQALGASIVVVRSGQSGAPDLIARHMQGHTPGHMPGCVINAGDGWHAHPTQALLDLFTLHTHLGELAGRRMVIVGDILHSRVARSNVWAL